MTGEIRFDGRVVVVTGAGGGLGRQHALEFARRGAKVVVNDLGGAVDGTGGSSEAAQRVVAEIESAGGQAIADGGSVADDAGAANLIKRTLDAYGRLDVFIANAGILRDRSFAKMEPSDFEAVMDVHLMGTVKPLRHAWPVLREQKYGRIVVTTSSTGLYGNFGQANYGAAKLALVGLMNTLKIEGERDGVRVNAICPVAATRMTESLLPPPLAERLKPEYVTPAVIYLASEHAPTGVILTAGAGVFAQTRIYETEGVYLGEGGLSAEEVRDNADRIADPSGQQAYGAGQEQTQKFMRKMMGG
jgi:NAD(P)-dependent dehydrogenase (short-subunit alcohol dehydrogenase family)